jgi:hypothetical protein
VLLRPLAADTSREQISQLHRTSGRRSYLKREDFAQQFGADPGDIADVKKFAVAHGLAVVQEHPARKNGSSGRHGPSINSTAVSRLTWNGSNMKAAHIVAAWARFIYLMNCMVKSRVFSGWMIVHKPGLIFETDFTATCIVRSTFVGT